MIKHRRILRQLLLIQTRFGWLSHSNMEAHIVDSAGKPVAPHQAGEPVVRGLNVMQSYWNAPELTVESTLCEFPGVKEVAVIAVPDKFNGKVVKAFSLIYHPHDILLVLAYSFAS